MNERGYWSKEISAILDIGDSTLRKWCLALEKQDYSFVRATNNSRAFVDKDIIVLRRMKDLIQDKGIKLEVAAQIVVAGMNVDERTEGVPEEEQQENYLPTVDVEAEKFDQILEYMRKQEEFNRALINKLEEQHKYYEAKMSERDKKNEEREQLLLQKIEELQEDRKLLGTIENQKNEEYSKRIEERLNEQEERAEERDKQILEKLSVFQVDEEQQSERDQLLQKQLEEIKETKRLIAAANEQKKQGFFSRLFNK